MSPSPPRSEEQSRDLTLLLNQMQHGDPAAREQAVELVYGELHRIAARELHRERPGHLLQTTALIHEAYLRLVGAETLQINNRMHFFAIASQQMRRILVDYARAKNAKRRGSGMLNVTLTGVSVSSKPRGIDFLLLDEALRDLQEVDPRAAQIVELRYFGGHTDKEAAEALGISVPTVRRDWEFARSWLFDRMQGKPTPI
jgi:RNA polymerase sigma factor (TIGR02999 family)